ncbi:hypothetical protein EST38_g6579 [Candolleomyces aberdarensis]|uniref:Uncharacterized protein n=1 Tax=Candolleomyces aberdarensis TaxID=2316362 RepID=A0A4Q2DJD2_9AGAR|nr:hypothetical protein EST38_g6579 [Candolleomyces aberdarensis]
MRPSRKLCLNSATALLLAASQLVSAADVDWEPYLEGYKNSLHNFGIFDGRRTAKPAPAELRKSRPVADVNGNTIPDYDVLYEFDQLIDHNNASRGTFKMRYYHTWEYYREGGPIILYVLGEEGIDVNRGERSLTNATIPGAIAQATNGAVVVVEHRFYGKSKPFPDLSANSLRFHTISQALEDFVYFALNVKLAMPGGDGEGIRPDRSPWIFVGGSYSGALAAFIMEQYPGIFWAAYASSAAVQPKIDFWQYWSPIEQHMPANCTADVKAVVSLIDGVIDSGNQTRMTEIKTQFGLGSLGTIDFVNTINIPFRTWQALQPASARNSIIYPFCDALETRGGQVAGAEGWGAQIALPKYAEFSRTAIAYLCGNTTTEALQCNEAGWFQPGPPNGGGIVSKHFNVQAWATFCSEAFPGTFTNSLTEFQARVDVTLQQYNGWNTMANRVFVVNGRRDPWLEVTLSATEVNASGTDLRPIYLTNGFHGSDISHANAVVEPSVGEVWNQALTTFSRWVSEFERQGSSASEVRSGLFQLVVVVAIATLSMLTVL